MSTSVKIRENSWLAKLAAKKLKASSVAMVIGNTIYLCNSSKEHFLENKVWVRHEVAHVEQYRRLGVLRFILLYLIESMLHGYENNKFELEARQKENDMSVLSKVSFE